MANVMASNPNDQTKKRLCKAVRSQDRGCHQISRTERTRDLLRSKGPKPRGIQPYQWRTNGESNQQNCGA